MNEYIAGFLSARARCIYLHAMREKERERSKDVVRFGMRRDAAFRRARCRGAIENFLDCVVKPKKK